MSALDENTLNGNFKDQYGSGPISVYPEQVKLQKMFAFNEGEADRTGQFFIELIQVGQSWGTTKAGTTATNYTLASAIAGQTQPAKIKGNQVTNREQIAVAALTRAQTDPQAFLTATQYPVFFLNRAAKTVLELSLMHGQYGLANITSSVNTSTTVTVLQVTTADWSEGIWSASEGMPLQAFDNNTGSDVLITGGGESEFTISAVDFANKKLTITCPTVGLIAAIDAAILANPGAINLYHRVQGAVTNEMVGLHVICGHISGTLFDLNSDNWSVWRGNQFDSAGIFTFDKLEQCCSQLYARGVEGEFELICNAKTWSSLAKQNNALRIMDSSYSKSEVDYGTKSIKYHTANGSVSIVAHMYAKYGYAYLFKKGVLKRVGSSDIIFNDPLNNEKFFFTLQDSNGVELRTFTDQSLFTNELKACLRISGITY
jgi:hypothetical protein